MDLKGSRTEKNILTAFAGESQARNRYTYFASKAKKEGFVQMSSIFEETADQEKEHAKRLFKFLKGGEVEISAAFPAGVIGSTLENLKESAAGEHYEHTEMYPGFADVAREEGFNAVADVFMAIAVAEKQHEKRYNDLAANIEAGRVFKRDTEEVWRCRNCGYLHKGEEAHPMEEKHYIEWIEIIADGSVYRQFLKPGDAPEATFNVKADQVVAREYCTLHGLWKA